MLSPGDRLGRYEILSSLGAGGMGEVYRARDPELGREVALKLITTDGAPSADRLRRFETEARAAASLSHPNVVTVFDVGRHEGRPYLILELLEGQTLRERLRREIPTLRQAVTWAGEVAQGLGAAHEHGIVHRDLKPENLFLTKDGRLKVLDFGLAKLRERREGAAGETRPTETRETTPGAMLGTVGYMAPEQVRAEEPDARTDVFALGAVLFELVTRRRPFTGRGEGEVLAAILRDDPPTPSSLNPAVSRPLEKVVLRCLSKASADRFASAGEVSAALETVLESLGPERATPARELEPRGPYPGLASFEAEDAGSFFGREAEVEALWQKLQERRLLAVIGPSGVGKTSFVRAGILAACPSGWRAVVCAPGASPFRSLGQALAPELAGDPEALREVVGFDAATAFDVEGRWRRSHGEALVILDQFEELFTLASPEDQRQFAALVGRLATDGDTHVVLSLRDDFLMRCGEHPALARVFSELTPLLPLAGEALRRAVEEPARREGYAFEDGLVDEMLQAVEGARGALPLLAFAVSRVWERRDEERRLLTRAAYEEIGGVAGALAQHAEATLERIGREREPLVREIFRNLVTSHGTRASAEREELLSVFPVREAAEDALAELIDARLLTSYEVTDTAGHFPHDEADPIAAALGDAQAGPASGPTTHRIEIVHESLLKAWPRLVMWQAQEEEGAVLRDQLRQAAHLWDERGRSPDVLWTGAAYLDFVAWRERYEGGLTASEEAFARAMTANAHKRRRRRRLATAALVVALSAGVAFLWQAWDQAAAEARRAEASELRALGTPYLESDPSAALAYAIAGLERFDSPTVRRFALEALAAGPPGLFVDVDSTRPAPLRFSPDGEWLAAAGCLGARLLPRDGSPPVVLEEGYLGGGSCGRHLEFAPDGDHAILRTHDERVSRIWSLSRRDWVRRLEHEGWTQALSLGGRLLLLTRTGQSPEEEGWLADTIVREYDPESGDTTVLERWAGRGVGWFSTDAAGRWLLLNRVDDPRLYLRPVWGREPVRERVVARLDTPVGRFTLSPHADRIAAWDANGAIHVWSFDGETARPLRTFSAEGQLRGLWFDPSGRRLAGGYASDDPSNTLVRVWDLAGIAGADPVELRSGTHIQPFPGVAFDPDSRVLATAYRDQVGFFPVEERPQVLRGEGMSGGGVAFTPDGRSLVAYFQMASLIRTWALDGSGWRDLWRGPAQLNGVAIDPQGRHLVATTLAGAFLVSLTDGTARELPDAPPRAEMGAAVAISADGRFVAAARLAPPEQQGIRIWDLHSLEYRVLDESRGRHVVDLVFAPDGTLLSSDRGGAVSSWKLEDDTRTILAETGGEAYLTLSPDGRSLLVSTAVARFGSTAEVSSSTLHDLTAGTSRPFAAHGENLFSAAFDPTSQRIVTGDTLGAVRVGPVIGETPHLLLGHRTGVLGVAFSPDGRWIASSDGGEPTVRLWAMPRGRPLHTLPYEAFMAHLRAKTNLRVVRSEESASGYRLHHDPFPGWAALAEGTAP